MRVLRAAFKPPSTFITQVKTKLQTRLDALENKYPFEIEEG
jgi:hypothetical protein